MDLATSVGCEAHDDAPPPITDDLVMQPRFPRMGEVM